MECERRAGFIGVAKPNGNGSREPDQQIGKREAVVPKAECFRAQVFPVRIDQAVRSSLEFQIDDADDMADLDGADPASEAVGALEFMQRIAQIAEYFASRGGVVRGRGNGPEEGISQLENAPDSHLSLCYVRLFARTLMRISSKAPCRVDLAGSTLDIWPLYLFHEDAVTVNFAVDRYTYCELTTRDDSRIVLRSKDMKAEETFESLAHLRAAPKYRLPILALLVRFFAPELGIVLESDSEAPAGAGISGSSALMIAIASALNRLTGRGYKMEKLREIVQNIEAQVIRVPTGAQDYFPAMYGGVSAIELNPSGVHRREIAVDCEELNARFVLAYTGAPRNSGINNWEVMKGHINGDRAIFHNFARIASIAVSMRGALERKDWNEAARLMRDDWSNRRKNIPTITTPLIDRLIASTRRAGSTGAKVCGAGGGGCVVFLVEPDAKEKVSRIVEESGAKVIQARVSRHGVKVR